MKRRNFLKLIAAAVVCPKGLLTKDRTRLKDTNSSCISGEKPGSNAGAGERRWVCYYDDPALTKKEEQELVKKLREAHKNTKFKSPVHTKCFYFRGVQCFYQSKLDG